MKEKISIKHKLTLVGLAMVACLSMPNAASACDMDRPIKIADGNWDAVQVLDSIAAFILKNGYDCKSEMVKADMVPLFTAVGKGDADVFMDIWIDNNKEIYAKTIEDGAVDLGVLYPDGTEGWYVPRYLIDGDSARGIKAAAPDLKSVKDLLTHKELFDDPEQPGKGRFLNCPIGWGCEQTNNRKLEAYGLANDFVNFKTGSGAALDAAFASAYKRGQPIVGYYWSPTWLLGLYDMVKLEEPACTEANADACAFPTAESHLIASAQFVEKGGAVVTFFQNFKTSSAQISQMLAYLHENEGSTRDDAALDFLRSHPDIWSTWVPAVVAEKVKAAL